MSHHPPADNPALRYPENLGIHTPQNLTIDMAASMLQRAVQMSAQVPFIWGFIDRPADGQVVLLYVPTNNPLPFDGIRYQDNENRASIPLSGGRELETTEIKFGFIPGSGEPFASRTRRTFRLRKGGNPSLVLVHWTRGPQAPVMPSLASIPVRSYPLRPVNEPHVFVIGEKAGTKVAPGPITLPGSNVPLPGTGPGAPPFGGAPPGMPGPGGIPGGGGMHAPGAPNVPGAAGGMPGAGGPHPGAPGMPMGMPGSSHAPPFGVGPPQVMLAQQNREMEALERRRPVPGAGAHGPGGMPGGPPGHGVGGMSGAHGAGMPGGHGVGPAGPGMPGAPPHQQGRVAGRAQMPRVDDDNSDDEMDRVSTRTLARTRYMRNHDFMNEVFAQAAFRDQMAVNKPTPAYSMFDKDEVEEKTAKLNNEIEVLRRAAEERRHKDRSSGVGMGMMGEPMMT